MAVERMRSSDNIGDLAKKLGVGRRCLYKWQAKLDHLVNSAPNYLAPTLTGFSTCPVTVARPLPDSHVRGREGRASRVTERGARALRERLGVWVG